MCRTFRAAPDPRLSRSVEYATAILECFSSASPSLGVADLADAIGISRSTAHRYLTTHVMLGLVEQDSRHRHRLAWHAADAGMSALGVIVERTGSRAVLGQLRDQTGHTATLAVLDGARVTYVQRAHAHRRGQYEADMDLGAGAHAPLHCTALGKAMLAHLPEEQLHELRAGMKLARKGPNTIATKRDLRRELARINADGLAIGDEEHAKGVRSVAAAISDPTKWGTLAVEVTVLAAQCSLEQLVDHIGQARTRNSQRGAYPRNWKRPLDLTDSRPGAQWSCGPFARSNTG